MKGAMIRRLGMTARGCLWDEALMFILWLFKRCE
jgi:hypothetical protein